MPVILVLRRLRQKDCLDFETSLGYKFEFLPQNEKAKRCSSLIDNFPSMQSLNLISSTIENTKAGSWAWWLCTPLIPQLGGERQVGSVSSRPVL